MDRYHAVSDVSCSKDRDRTDEEDNIRCIQKFILSARRQRLFALARRQDASKKRVSISASLKSQERALNGKRFGTSRLFIGKY